MEAQKLQTVILESLKETKAFETIKSGQVKHTAKPVAKHQKRQKRIVINVVPVICINSVQHMGRCVVAVVKQTTSQLYAGARMVERA